MQKRGTPPVRLVRQAPDHRVTSHALTPAASTPPILTNNPACQHCMVWPHALTRHLQAQVIQTRERAQVRTIKDSIGHVEVFQMDGVAISIIERPRPLHNHDTPNAAHNTYTLKCEEPHNRASTAGADGSRAGRRPRAHKAARPKQQCEGRCTRYGPLHPLRGGTPDQKGCTAYGSGAAHPITRTNAESARRGPGCGARGRRLGLAGLRGDAPSEARGADGSRAGRRPRAHKAARPKQQCEGRCTRYGPLHPLRGGTPDQKGCTAYGSGAAHPITRTNAESARRGPGCGARGRQRGLAGLRDDAPSEARGADGSRAGHRPRAHKAAQPSAAAQPQLSRHSTSRRRGHPRR